MASLLLEQVGGTVGYRIRFDARVGKDTQIEVVTGGVFTRMLADDPGLENVAAVLFDEFHERSLEGDLSLALCLDVQSALREDLRLLPMSATLDGAAIAELMGARVLESKGRSYPVEVIYRERPPDVRIENAGGRAGDERASTWARWCCSRWNIGVFAGTKGNRAYCRTSGKPSFS